MPVTRSRIVPEEVRTAALILIQQPNYQRLDQLLDQLTSFSHFPRPFPIGTRQGRLLCVRGTWAKEHLHQALLERDHSILDPSIYPQDVLCAEDDVPVELAEQSMRKTYRLPPWPVRELAWCSGMVLDAVGFRAQTEERLAAHEEDAAMLSEVTRDTIAELQEQQSQYLQTPYASLDEASHAAVRSRAEERADAVEADLYLHLPLPQSSKADLRRIAGLAAVTAIDDAVLHDRLPDLTEHCMGYLITCLYNRLLRQWWKRLTHDTNPVERYGISTLLFVNPGLKAQIWTRCGADAGCLIPSDPGAIAAELFIAPLWVEFQAGNRADIPPGLGLVIHLNKGDELDLGIIASPRIEVRSSTLVFLYHAESSSHAVCLPPSMTTGQILELTPAWGGITPALLALAETRACTGACF